MKSLSGKQRNDKSQEDVTLKQNCYFRYDFFFGSLAETVDVCVIVSHQILFVLSTLGFIVDVITAT